MIGLYEELIKMKDSGEPAMMVTVVEMTGNTPVAVGKKMLVGESGTAFGTVGGGALELFAKNKCTDLIKDRVSMTEKYVLSEGKIVEGAESLPMACGGTVKLFYEYIGVRGHIYIFGAGHVGQALIKVLKTMNFYVTVIDAREDMLAHVLEADRKVHMSYADFIDKEGLREQSYVVVCTPSHKHDYNVVNKVLELNLTPKYMGMLCSEVKLRSFMKKTFERFGDDIDLSYFYSPIGLDTGGDSPAEIAISISSEILAISYHKKGHCHMRKDAIIDQNRMK
ncbi:XdhC family protein [Vallitalea pronyensis]|uniref:XdhC family protein n=1 Tax=Vallitalea pronyensis TaxID=1348613 RepID=A0A8J8ML47_9FIRM|nr:XdhC/CoxI family protein [Vallitalea pronyensis]QUI23494.1 XdhC family protein [Vallitalea pronyensis]